MDDAQDYQATANSLGLEFEAYAKRLGIPILEDGVQDPRASKLDRPLSYVVEHRVQYIAMSVRKFSPLATAAKNARDSAKKFLDENQKNIVSLRSVRGAVMDDPFNGCIKFCVAFVGTIRQFAEDGTMNTLGA